MVYYGSEHKTNVFADFLQSVPCANNRLVTSFSPFPLATQLLVTCAPTRTVSIGHRHREREREREGRGKDPLFPLPRQRFCFALLLCAPKHAALCAVLSSLCAALVGFRLPLAGCAGASMPLRVRQGFRVRKHHALDTVLPPRTRLLSSFSSSSSSPARCRSLLSVPPPRHSSCHVRGCCWISR